MSATLTALKPPMSSEASCPDATQRIAALADGWSLEATLPNDSEVSLLQTIVPPPLHVYLGAVPTRDPKEQIAAAVRLHRAGFAPVPHVAVRNFAGTEALDAFLGTMAGDAGVRRVLVIAGDRDQPSGPFRSAVEAIDSGVMQRHGISKIDIAGYPAGHPRIPQHELDRALAEKIEIADQLGLAVEIVTQFCFEPEPIIAWIARLRDFGIDNPVRIGLAGPSNIATLLRYARRCGVRASAQGLARQSGLARQIFGMSAPDTIVRALAEAHARDYLGAIALHFYSFGGIVTTARWARAVRAGRIMPDATGGFQVAPPLSS